jgi:transcriptional regulator with XRE-family HTH domain
VIVNYETRLLSALERGSKKEIDNIFNNGIDPLIPLSFTSYMDMIIHKKGMKRQDIAQRADLSRSYSYKLLTGEKRTKDRDKIILLCMALEMAIEEVQTALDLYPFPRLNKQIKRDTLIILAIKNKKSIDELDEWLDKLELSLLSRSKSEDLGNFPPNRSIYKSKDNVQSNHSRKIGEERSTYMEVISKRGTSTLMCQDMYAYDAEMVVKNDEGKIVYLHANYSYGDHFTVSNASIYDWMTTASEEEPKVTFLEEYDSLESTSNSKYAGFFQELDKMTDEVKVKTDSDDDDTANYGWRCVGNVEGGKIILFCELYIAEQKEYAQVQYFPSNKKYIFSVSKESYFKLFELGPELYEAMIGRKKIVHFVEEGITLEQAEKSLYAPGYSWLRDKVKEYERHLN